MRTTPRSAPGTAISWAHRSGTSVQPNSRAAMAGKEAVISGVVVKMALTTSSAAISLRRMMASSRSVVASRMSSEVLVSTVVARVCRDRRRIDGRSLLAQARILPGREPIGFDVARFVDWTGTWGGNGASPRKPRTNCSAATSWSASGMVSRKLINADATTAPSATSPT